MTAPQTLRNRESVNAGSGSLDHLVSRRRFEEWIGQSPYEREIDRFPNDETRFAWPGQYKDIGVQLAWEAWSEAANAAISRRANND